MSYEQVRRAIITDDFLSRLQLGSKPTSLRDVMSRWRPETQTQSGVSFDRVKELLQQGKPVIALITTGDSVRLSRSESAAIYQATGNPIGWIIGLLDPLNFPVLHYVTLNGINVDTQTIHGVDTDGSTIRHVVL